MEGTGENKSLTEEEINKKKEALINKIIGVGLILVVLTIGIVFFIDAKVIKPNNFAKCGEKPTPDERYYCCLKNGSLGAAGADSCYHIYKLNINETYGK